MEDATHVVVNISELYPELSKAGIPELNAFFGVSVRDDYTSQGLDITEANG
jgi:hypothetical protein